MANDRMMQAIATLDRAIAALEQVALTAPAPESSTPIASPTVTAEARAALLSLDLLIADLKSGVRGSANG